MMAVGVNTAVAAGEYPGLFTAYTEKVYVEAPLSPYRVWDVRHGSTDSCMTGSAPLELELLMTYHLISAPPSSEGGDQDRLTPPPETRVTVRLRAAEAFMPGSTVRNMAGSLSPVAFWAFNVKVYSVPFVKPVTMYVQAAGSMTCE